MHLPQHFKTIAYWAAAAGTAMCISARCANPTSNFASAVNGTSRDQVAAAPPGFADPRAAAIVEVAESNRIVALGRQLFFDRKLSADRTIACASCHRPDHGWSSPDKFPHGVGGRAGKRQTPSLYNVGLRRYLFWDGRAESLAGTVLFPIQDPQEMNLPLSTLLQRLREDKEYRRRFASAGVNVDERGVARALAAYCRTIVATDAPFDRFRAGDASALTPAARRGHDLFFFRLNCGSCHTGSQLSDGKFHNLGIGAEQPEPDLGRFLITGEDRDRGAFKTPSLRNIVKTAPYMHDGRFQTLDEVVDFYRDGGHYNRHLDPLINLLPIDDQQHADLVAFLKEGLTSSADPAAEAVSEIKAEDRSH